MKAGELAEILLRHPEYEVVVLCPETVEGVDGVEVDCFDLDQGTVFVIELDGDDEA